MQMFMDRLLLQIPIFGNLIEKSVIARWTRTLSTMFAAGVPLVESLDSVGGAAGNYIYKSATQKIQQEVSTGTSLTNAMSNANVFPVDRGNGGDGTSNLSRLQKRAEIGRAHV